MVFEHEIPNFMNWFVPAILWWFPLAVVMLCVLGWLLGFLTSAVRRGPVEGFYSVAKVIGTGVNDVLSTSVRRTHAIALLAIQEAIRRKVLVAFGVFVVAMLFAGWFLDVNSDEPARLYLSFVLTTSTYLVLILALLLSTFSLPTDMKNKTIYTIVTKPVRMTEIVLGRIVGFSLMGSFLLSGMCLVSYLFVIRGLDHSHQVDLAPTAGDSVTGSAATAGETTFDAYHRHTFEVNEEGEGETNVVKGHKHIVRRTGQGASATYEFGPPLEQLQARNPVYGSLAFLDRAGTKTEKGVNVGHEWAYRSYVEGGSLASAIWTFEDVSGDRFKDGIDLEMNLRAFRTHKGNIERGVRGELFLKNPNSGANVQRSEEIRFVMKEFTSDKRFIPRKLRMFDKEGNVVDGDVFESLVDNGKIEVHIRCTDPGQYLGMATSDVYLLDTPTPFFLNFIKGYVGIWLQMVLVTAFGVMFSTFLSAPVAMMATLSSIVVGYLGEFIAGVRLSTINPESLEAVQGGGPIESLIRLVLQQNLQSDPEIGSIAFTVVKYTDFFFMQCLSLATQMVPNYVGFSTADYVANGYNIDAGVMGILLLKTLAYSVTVSLVAFFFLKTREVAAT